MVAARGVEAGGADALWVAPLRFAAGCTTFCPVVALLGAKRPQDRHWWLIVGSLWVVLSLPSLETLLLQPGQALEVQDARSWFLAVLILLSSSQWLLTRHWRSSILLGFGQAALLGPCLPGNWPSAPWLAAACFCTALAAASGRRPAKRNGRPWDLVWLDFRDAFGLLWSLRVCERLSAAAALGRWPETLTWEGWAPIAENDATWTDEAREAREAAVRGLLRRFVPSDWIDARLEQLP